jgi:hypothetical protein
MSLLPNEVMFGLYATRALESIGDSWPDEFYEEEEGGYLDYAGRTWVFNTALDERTCGDCGPLEGSCFLEEDIEPYFPDAEQLDDETIAVNLHDWCRCGLVLVEEYESVDLEGLF